MSLNELIKQHKAKVSEIDRLVYDYMVIGAIIHEKGKENIQGEEKQIKKIRKDYQGLREELYEIGDEIAKSDKDLLDSIVVPNPEDIDDAKFLYTESEWKKKFDNLPLLR